MLKAKRYGDQGRRGRESCIHRPLTVVGAPPVAQLGQKKITKCAETALLLCERVHECLTFMTGMAPERTRRRIPDATVARLPVYLRILTEQGDEGVDSISSERLAELGGVNAAKVRKDLSYLGSYGTRGVGYEVAYLVYQIRRELGLTHDWPVVIVGAGNLGQALAGYGGFGERGFPVAGIVDIDSRRSARCSVAFVFGTSTNCPRSSAPSASASESLRPLPSQHRMPPIDWCAPVSPAS